MFGGVIKLENSNEFIRDLKACEAATRKFSAEEKYAEATSKAFGDSVQHLSKLSEVLQNKLSSQYDKLAILRKQYELFSQQQQQNKTRYDELLKKYDDEKSKLEQLKQTLGVNSQEYKKQVDVVRNLGENVRRNTALYESNEKAISNLDTKIIRAESSIQKTRNSISQLNQKMQESKQKADEASSTYGKLKDTISQQERELSKLKNQHTNVVLEQGKNSNAAKDLGNKIKNLSGDLQSNKNKLGEAERSSEKLAKSYKGAGEETKNFSERISTFDIAVGNFVSGALMRLTYGLKNFAGDSLRASMDYEAGMSQVKAITGATDEQMAQLTKVVRNLAKDTKFTAKEAADAAIVLGRSGKGAGEIMQFLESVLKGAAASGEDLTQVTKIIVNNITSLGVKAEEAAKVVDVLATAAASSNTEISIMGEAFKYVAPLAGATNQKIEALAFVLGVLANAGIQGSKAGTDLRQIMLGLSNPTKAAKDELNKLSIEIFNADGTMKPLTETMGALREKIGDLTDEQKLNIAETLVGKRAAGALLAIVKASPEEYEKLSNACNNATGSAERMSKIMLDNAQGAFTIFKSNLGDLGIALYEKFKPALETAIKIASSFVDALRFIVEHSKEMGIGLKTAGAALATYLGYTSLIKAMTEGWKSLAIVQKTVAIGQKAINAVMSANKIGLIITLLTAAASAIVMFSSETSKAKQEEKRFQEEMEKSAQVVKDQSQQFDNLMKERQKAIDVGEKEISKYEELVEELDKLVDQNGKVKDGYNDRVNVITKELSKATGIEIKNTNGVIDNYDKLKNKIAEVIKQKEAQIYLDAQKSAYEEAIKNQTEAVKNLQKIEKERADLRDKIAKQEKEIFEKSAKHTGAYTSAVAASFQTLSAEIEENKRKEKELTKTYDEQKEQLGKYFFEIGQYTTNLTKLQKGEYENINNILWDNYKQYKQTGDAKKAQLEDEVKITEKLLKILKEEYDKTGDEIYKGQIKDGEKKLKKLKEELELYNDTTDKELSKTKLYWNSNLAEQLSDISKKKVEFKTAGRGTIEAFVNGQLLFKAKSKEEAADILKQSILALSEKHTGAEEAGKDLIRGFNLGIANKTIQNGVFGTIKNFIKKLFNTIKGKEGVDSHSPSKKTEKIGKDVSKGLAIGIKEEENSTANVASGVAKKTLNAIKKPLGKGKKVGNKIAQDVQKGIAEKEDPVVKQAESFIDKVIGSLKGEAKSEEVLKSIKELLEYIENGFKEKESAIVAQVKSIGNAITENLKKKLPIDDLKNQLKIVYQQLETTIKEKEKSLSYAMEDTWKSAINSAKKKSLSSQDAIKIVKEFIDAAKKGFKEDNSTGIEVTKWLNEIKDAVDKGMPLDEAYKKGEELIKKFEEGIKQKEDDPKKALVGAFKKATDAAGKEGLTEQDAIKIINNFIDGAKKGFKKDNSIGTEVTKWLNEIKDAADKGMPLDEFYKKGQDLIKKFGEGIGAAHQEVLEKINVIGKKAVEDLSNSYKKIDESKTKFIESNERMVQSNKTLFGVLDKLVSYNGTIKKGYEERVNLILGELSRAFGVEVKTVDGVIQNYGILKNSIDDVIEKKRAQIILDSQKTGYEEAMKNQIEIEQLYVETEQQLIESKKALKEAEKEQSQEKIQRIKEETAVFEENHEKQKELLEKYAYSIGQYEKNMQLLHQGKYQEMSRATWDYVKQYKNASEAEKATLLQQIELTRANLKVVKELREKTGSDIYDSQIKNAKKELASLKKRLKNYNTTTSEELQKTKPIWIKSLNEQLAKVDQKKEDFKKAGQDSISSFSKGIEISEEKPRKVMSDVATKTIEEIKKKEPEAKQAGEQIAEGLKIGIEEKTGEAVQAAENMGRAVAAGFKREAGIASPSKVFKEFGKYIDEGLAIGIENNKDKVIKAIKGINIDMIKEKIKINFKDIGRLLSNSIYEVNEKMQKIQSFEINQNITQQINNKNLVKEIAELTKEIHNNKKYTLELANKIDKLPENINKSIQEGMSNVEVKMDREKLGEVAVKAITNEIYHL